MIKRITKIRNFGIFKNFNWNQDTPDAFDKLTIIYGRNYTGKTTLSRIIRSFEKGELYKNSTGATFEIELDDGELVTEKSIDTNTLDARVFNVDFIKENLRWLIDEKGVINSFAMLGVENIAISEEIELLEKQKGDDTCGLKRDLTIFQESKKRTEELIKGYDKSTNEKLKAKARHIKHDTQTFNLINYNITKLNSDILQISNTKDHILDSDNLSKLKSIIGETPKQKIPEIKLETQHSIDLYNKCILALNTIISPSNSIKELLNDSKLQEWVHDGAQLHRSKLDKCAFCGKELTSEDWQRIDDHFNQSSEDLRTQLRKLETHIQNIILSTKQPELELSHAYSEYEPLLADALNNLKNNIHEHLYFLKRLEKLIFAKQADIFSTKTITLDPFDHLKILSACESLNELIKSNNLVTANLEHKKVEARRQILLHELSEFIEESGVKIEQEKSEKLKISLSIIDNKIQGFNDKLSEIELKITNLRAQLKDERRGAQKINEYLNHHFGCNSLSLKTDETADGCCFNLYRNDTPAFDLSEGEKSLVAFCYFMAKLQDIESSGKKLTIWIDDPISSLDSGHILFIFSMIENIIARPKKYYQLFITTHNLEFLKYLKKITAARKNINGNKVKLINHFTISNNGSSATIIPMPKHLKQFITEFNYLFGILYKCATLNETDITYEYHNNFGNNLRKFLESYLFYKYPDSSQLITKIQRFFDDDDTSASLIARIAHENSHIAEAIDRCMQPIEIGEIIRASRYIIGKIKNHDAAQFESLVRSIEAK